MASGYILFSATAGKFYTGVTKDQLRRASFSIVLNIAEGTGSLKSCSTKFISFHEAQFLNALLFWMF
ncbi:MAG TPA: hypothetical protein DDY18_03955 [Flavobacterium sp.]|nr:hypothetical protein [Flavobacterium sp.]